MISTRSVRYTAEDAHLGAMLVPTINPPGADEAVAPYIVADILRHIGSRENSRYNRYMLHVLHPTLLIPTLATPTSRAKPKDTFGRRLL